MIERIMTFIRDKLDEINTEHKVNIKLPTKVVIGTGADWDGDMIYVDGNQYFILYNTIYDVGIIDACSIKFRGIFGMLKSAGHWVF